MRLSSRDVWGLSGAVRLLRCAMAVCASCRIKRRPAECEPDGCPSGLKSQPASMGYDYGNFVMRLIFVFFAGVTFAASQNPPPSPGWQPFAGLRGGRGVGCGTIAGAWNWLNGRVITTIESNGHEADTNGGKGTWKPSGASYLLHWDTYNTDDILVLSPDGMTLTGT